MLSKNARGTAWQRTERKLLVDARADNVGVEDEAVGHVVQSEEDGIGEQKLEEHISIRILESKNPGTNHLGNVHAADGACGC